MFPLYPGFRGSRNIDGSAITMNQGTVNIAGETFVAHHCLPEITTAEEEEGGAGTVKWRGIARLSACRFWSSVHLRRPVT